MTIKRKRFQAMVLLKDGSKKLLRLYNEAGQGTSGFGVASKNAMKISKETFGSKAIAGVMVLPVTIKAELDLKKAFDCGAVSQWAIDDGNDDDGNDDESDD